MKTSELFKKGTVLSFEVFPPKPTSPEKMIYDALDEMRGLHPDFISVTYGAGGGANCDKSVEIAAAIKGKYSTESVAHLPCISLTKAEADIILEQLREKKIENILALRGDLPQDDKRGDFLHASDLIEYITSKGGFNCIAACYPEGHTESQSMSEDIRYTKHKTDCGATQLITQLFLDNEFFYDFQERAAASGISVPIQAGIMPVTNRSSIERMVSLCGIALPKKFMRIIDRYENNPQALADAGIAYAVDQITDLLAQGVDGIHLYTMNKPYVATKIYNAVHKLIEDGKS